MTEQTTEQKILIAAENEFLCKGFAAARTTSIAEAAGVTHAMLHYYFRTKDKLFERVLESKIELIRDMMLGSIDAPDTPLFDKLEMAISSHLSFLANNPNLPRFFINEFSSNSQRLKPVADLISANASKVIASLQQQIDEAAEAGLCRRVDAAMLMIDILSLNAFPFMAAPLLNLVSGNNPSDRDNFIARRKKETIDIVMRKLKP